MLMAPIFKRSPPPAATILDTKDQDSWTAEEWQAYALRLEQRVRAQQLEIDALRRRLSRKKGSPVELKRAPKGRLRTLLSPMTTTEQAAQILKVLEELKARENLRSPSRRQRITAAMAVREWFHRRGEDVPLDQVDLNHQSLLVAVSRLRRKLQPPKVTSRKS